jgi:hypothetical protein
LSFWRRKEPAPRPYLRRAKGPSEELRDFWFRQFRRHFEAEERGADPSDLVYRWLSLDAMTWNDRGPRVQIDLSDHVRHFLDDADIRSKDAAYADQQRRRVRKWLNAQ